MKIDLYDIVLYYTRSKEIQKSIDFNTFTEKPKWIIWLIWAIVGQYTDKMTQNM